MNTNGRGSRTAAIAAGIVVALSSGCSDQPGGGAVDAAVDVPSPDAGPAGSVRVWRREHVAVTRAQLMTMATAVGLTGTVEEDDAQLRMVGTTSGPAGPLVIKVAGFGALSFDSHLDLDALPGRLTGAITAAGAVTIATLELPPATTELPAGGIITVAIALAGNGAGMLDLATSRLTLSLPLTATATCAGAGCWSGSCQLALGTLALTTAANPWDSAPYNFATGEAGLAGDLAEPQVASCTSAAPATVADQLGFGSGFTSWQLTGLATPAFGPRQSSLVVDKHHGELTYSTPVVDDPPAAAQLPDEVSARARVTQLLNGLGVVLPEPLVTIARRKNAAGADVAVAIGVVPVLALDDTRKAPVEDAGAVIILGDGGRLESIQVRWTPVSPGPMVPAIDVDQAWAALGGTGPRPADALLALGYVGPGHGIDPPFLDPVWALLEPGGSSTMVVPATDFTPRLGLETVIANRTMELTGPLPLTAIVEKGTPPYTVTWTSSLIGALGAGLTIDARLSPGVHVVTIQVRDASGAGLSAQVPVEITSSPFPAPAAGPPAGVAVEGAKNVFPERIGASYLITTRKDRVGPKMTIRNARGERAGSISPGQFRYTMVVRVSGQPYILHSSRCVDEAREHQPACDFPSGDAFTQATEVEPVRWSAGAHQARARATYDRMPGKLTLDFRYTAANAYAGPPPAFYERAGAWLLHGSLSPQLGGVAPGVVPEVAWSYRLPDKGDDDACVTLYAIWFESQRLPAGDPDDVGFTTLTESVFAPCNAPPFSLPYEVESFELEMFSLVQPVDASGHYSTLVNDGATATSSLDATDGVLDRTHQPSPRALLGDGFTEITPIAAERRAVAARPGAAGDWDNWHGKQAPSPYFVTFPGCNNAFAKERLIDYRPCLHLHERWFNNPTASVGQDVVWNLVRNNQLELDPPRHPRRYVDGEAINGQPTILWHESKATSEQCENNGPGVVDNSGSPCRVFRSAVFETH